jgi:hypothetical protein
MENIIAKNPRKFIMENMSPNSITLSPEMQSKLGQCKPGETKKMTVTVKVGDVKDGFKGEIVEVSPYTEEAEPEPAATPKGKTKYPKAIQMAMEQA